jgi:hypothetical protein
VGSSHILGRSFVGSRQVLVKSWVGPRQVLSGSRLSPKRVKGLARKFRVYIYINTVKCFTVNHFSRNYFLLKIFSNENHFTSKEIEPSLISVKCHFVETLSN